MGLGRKQSTNTAAGPIGRAGFRSRESEAVRRFSKRDRDGVRVGGRAREVLT